MLFTGIACADPASWTRPCSGRFWNLRRLSYALNPQQGSVWHMFVWNCSKYIREDNNLMFIIFMIIKWIFKSIFSLFVGILGKSPFKIETNFKLLWLLLNILRDFFYIKNDRSVLGAPRSYHFQFPFIRDNQSTGNTHDKKENLK